VTPSTGPLFSAVIPVHNGEKYLSAAIHSALRVPYKLMELIVVDDGSNDSSARIMDSFSGTIRRLFQPNRGPAAARNLGLQVARGEIVGFLDADDLWTPGIVRALELLISCPDVDIVQGRVQEITDLDPDESVTCYGYISKPYRFINIGSAVYRRNVFAEIGGFDESMRFCEDYDWFLRAFDAGIQKARIDDVTLLYRAHSGAMTYGKTVHQIGMARVHKKAIERRRSGVANRSAGKSCPSVAEYIGARPPRPPHIAKPESNMDLTAHAPAEHISMRAGDEK